MYFDGNVIRSDEGEEYPYENLAIQDHHIKGDGVASLDIRYRGEFREFNSLFDYTLAQHGEKWSGLFCLTYGVKRRGVMCWGDVYCGSVYSPIVSVSEQWEIGLVKGILESRKSGMLATPGYRVVFLVKLILPYKENNNVLSR